MRQWVKVFEEEIEEGDLVRVTHASLAAPVTGVASYAGRHSAPSYTVLLGPVEIHHGTDLSGWTFEVERPTPPRPEHEVVAEVLGKVRGRSAHIRTVNAFGSSSNYSIMPAGLDSIQAEYEDAQ